MKQANYLKLSYRPEIDGLRAIAVVSVILYHAQILLFGKDWFTGGFIGVDIFFVISGYLITRLILSELQSKGSFSFLNFYERRARRILPMLFIVLFSALALGWVFLNSDHFVELAKSTVYAIFFAANFFFANELTQYGTSSALLKPLLHTWSLGVEEQFYLFFPILAVIAFKLFRKYFFCIIVALSLLSLVFSGLMELRNANLNFYLPFSRFWELAVGSMLAYKDLNYKPTNDRPLFNAASAVGFVAIAYAILFFDAEIPHPSFHTLIPIIGVALIIGFASKDNVAGKVLGSKPLASVGLLSYSAYLWHFPLFAFYRYEYGEPNVSEAVIIIIITFGLSYISYLFVETPFRNQMIFSKRTFSLFVCFFVILLLLLSNFVILNDGLRHRPYSYGSMAPNVHYASLAEYDKLNGSVCIQKRYSDNYDESIIGCEYGDISSQRVLVTIGDSHLRAIEVTLNEYAQKNNLRVVDLDIKGCSYFISNIPHRSVSRDLIEHVYQCSKNFEDLKRLISDLDAKVLLMYRWMFHLYPIDSFHLDMPTKNQEGVVEDESYREHYVLANGILSHSVKDKLKMLDSFVNGLASSSRQLYFVKSVPEISYNIEKVNRDFWIKSGWSLVLKELSISSNEYESRNKFLSLFLESVLSSKVTIVDTEKVFCDSLILGRCVAQFDSVPLYYDDDHLSKEGADLLINEFIEAFESSFH